MKVHELIENLRDHDPDAEAEVWISIHRTYGEWIRPAYNVQLRSDGKVVVIDNPEE
jgi:hypothetical protein